MSKTEEEVIERMLRLIAQIEAAGQQLKSAGPYEARQHLLKLVELGERLSNYSNGLKKAILELETNLKRKM
jgi:hypothetical protein